MAIKKLQKTIKLNEADVFNMQMLYTSIISDMPKEDFERIKKTGKIPGYIKTLTKIIKAYAPDFDTELVD